MRVRPAKDFHIPLHDHSHPTKGGPIAGGSGSGDSVTSSSGMAGAPIAFSGPLAASAVTVLDSAGWFTGTDAETVLAEIGAKLVGYTAHGNTGSTETFDALTGWHSATLNANCTFTFTGATSGLVAAMVLELLQDGTGSRLVTWPGSVVWPGGSAPTLSTAAGSTDLLLFYSRDGGTTWFGFKAGGSSGVTSVALTVPAEFSVAGSPVTTTGTLAVTKATQSANTVWAGPTSGSAAAPAFRALVAADIPSGVGTTDHEHINNIQFSGDGSTTAFELPAAPFDENAVVASVAGVIQDVTLSGTMLTTLTFASAPGSGTNNVRVDIVAVAA